MKLSPGILALVLLGAVLCLPARADKEAITGEAPPTQALDALSPPVGEFDMQSPVDEATLKMLAEDSRGPAKDLFPQIAPSVVVVRTPTGHGTGFVVDKAGWILTNNHVIAPASIDTGTGARYALIHFGEMQDGYMTINKQAIPAMVYATSPAKDLALLKLLNLPQNRDLKPIELAEAAATPGAECITIGHPTRGLFWSVRSGEVVGIGKYPHDTIDMVMPQFMLASTEKEKFEASLRQNASRKALLSTCGINPGDSGGPLLDEDGKLIAVNFAIPKMQVKDGNAVNLDKFSYHVHLDEVKDFIKEFPDAPEVFRPDYWPPAKFSKLLDKDGDDTYETWMFAIANDQPPSGILFDLDNDTKSAFVIAFQGGKADRNDFEAEFAWCRLPSPRTFYDRNNDGEFDLVLFDVDGDQTSDLSIELTDDGWKRVEMEKQTLLDPELFEDAELGERLKKLL